jgi:archaellum component FlaC
MNKFLFDENDLESLFVCLNCKKRIVSPRCLPCGENICMPCIESILDEGKKGIVCPYCHEYHAVPESGSFPENVIVLKYLKKFEDRFTSPKLSEYLSSQLKELVGKSNELENVVKTTKQAFSVNINRLRKSINEVTSDAHVFLDEQKDAFIKRVREYQAEAEKGWLGLDNYKEYFENVLEEITNFHDQWLNYLTKFTIDETELSKAYIEAQACLRRLEKEMFKLKENYLRGSILTFTKNPEEIQYDTIGRLSIKPQNEVISDETIPVKSHLDEQPS